MASVTGGLVPAGVAPHCEQGRSAEAASHVTWLVADCASRLTSLIVTFLGDMKCYVTFYVKRLTSAETPYLLSSHCWEPSISVFTHQSALQSCETSQHISSV